MATQHRARDMSSVRGTMASAVGTAKGGWKQASAHQAPLLAAGVAFYTFLSLFPAMIAAVLAYGLIADPETVADQSQRISERLPADAASIVTGQMDELTSSSGGSLGVGLVIALALALYSASGGVGNLIVAVNTMFGFEETRGFVKRKLLALGLTVGAIIFLAVTLTLVAVVPAVLDQLIDVPGLRVALEAARWLMLLVALVVGIGVLFRVAPNRPTGPDHHDPKLVTTGVVIASALWVLVSVVFSLYVDNFGSYGKTYGALAGVVVLLLWLWIGLFALLLGSAVTAVRQDAPVVEEAVEAAESGRGDDGDPAHHRAPDAPTDRPARESDEVSPRA